MKSHNIELNSQGLPIYSIIDDEENTFEYQNGNLIKLVKWDGPHIYTYDDKKSPFYNCQTPKWCLICGLFDGYADLNNNRITEELEWRNETINYSYTYDDEGFPLTTKTDDYFGVDYSYTYITQ